MGEVASMGKIKGAEVLSRLYGREEIGDSYIRFQIDLSEITERYRDVCSPFDISLPGKEIIRGKFAEGVPLMAFTPLSLSLSHLTECFRDIVSVFQAHKACSWAGAMWGKTLADEQFIKAAAGAAFSFDFAAVRELAEPTPLDKLTFILICQELIKPFFHLLAACSVDAVPIEHWRGGYCPICGGTPAFARLGKEDEGKRYLWCSNCDVEWPFQRLCCPFCQDSGHDKLEFLSTGFREELRIDVCEKCSGYIKTIDERKTGHDGPTVFPVENAASLYLDIMAVENGYMKHLPSVNTSAAVIFPGDLDN
jgi:FdhE protein